MRNLENFKLDSVPHHLIVLGLTSEPDYEMQRVLLVEDFPDYGDFTIVEGGHCSCYGFDETKWDATAYSKAELIEVVKGWLDGGAMVLNHSLHRLSLRI